MSKRLNFYVKTDVNTLSKNGHILLYRNQKRYKKCLNDIKNYVNTLSMLKCKLKYVNTLTKKWQKVPLKYFKLC